MYVPEQRMLCICLEVFPVAPGVGRQQPRLLKAVQLETDGIGGLAELMLQATQIAAGTAVEEEFQ